MVNTDTVEADIDEPDIRESDHPPLSILTNKVERHRDGDSNTITEGVGVGIGASFNPPSDGNGLKSSSRTFHTAKSTTATTTALATTATDYDDEPKTITRRATFGGTGTYVVTPSPTHTHTHTHHPRFVPQPQQQQPQSLGQLLKPERKLAPDPTWTTSFVNSIKSSYFVWLLPFVPICWTLHATHQSDILVSIFSFIAILPLASLLSFATEQIALRVGDALGGLLNATFGNAVELLICVLALTKGKIGLVQASMVGSILSNTLLVLGMCYFAGGLRFHEQMYTIASSQVQISLLGLSISAIVLPAGYHYASVALLNSSGNSVVDSIEEEKHILAISRGLSFMLLSVYIMYLVFILYTHAYLFKLPRAGRPHHQPGQPHPNHAKVFPKPSWMPSLSQRRGPGSAGESHTLSTIVSSSSRQSAASTLGETMELGGGGHGREGGNVGIADDGVSVMVDTVEEEGEEEEQEEEEEVPKLKPLFAVALLLSITGIAGYTAEVLLDSIDGLTQQGGVSEEFVGLILLPLVGNSVEHVAAVTVSVKDKLDLSMAIAIGSSIQVSLCLLPILVLVGWAIGQPMSLYFDNFETISLAVSLLLVNFAISDGRTQYLEGYILMVSYAMIALVCWFYDPTSTTVI